MLQWLLVGGGLLAFAAATRPSQGPKTVVLEEGRIYRIKLEVLRASVPITPAILEGVRQGLEMAGMRDIRIVPGVRPTVEYTQTTVVRTELKLGTEIEFNLGGATLTIRFLWAKPTGNAGV